MVRWLIGTTLTAAVWFFAGFLAAAICAADAIKSGKLDPAIDEMRRRRPWTGI